MIVEMKVERGIVVFDGNKFIGRMIITNHDGIRQLHSDNVAATMITSLKVAKRFLKEEKDLFTGCFVGDNKLEKLLVKLGFVKVKTIGNVNTFYKE